MRRTRTRPIPVGKIAPDDALGFAIFASLFAVTLMAIATNFVAAFYLLFANMFYVLVYTIWLKRRTPQNIVIGGAAGAFPPVIGWAMVTGDATLAPWLLFALIFFWTPPHFWALALFANDDYRAANVPMLPVVKGERHTKWQMLAYTILLLPLSLAPTLIGVTGWGYGAFSVLLNVIFIIAAIATLRETDGSHKMAKRMFGYSVLYLFALFLSMMVDKV
jgi:protoheme IX farnesyltransferase